jgi:hypothetical protein
MSALAVWELLEALQRRGVELRPEGQALHYRCPKGALTDGLRAQIQEHKTEIMAVLCGSPDQSTAHVGRHGEPCLQCGDTWQWPTTTGSWVCAWCFVLSSGRVGED